MLSWNFHCLQDFVAGPLLRCAVLVGERLFYVKTHVRKAGPNIIKKILNNIHN
jgi:hypothetical protein